MALPAAPTQPPNARAQDTSQVVAGPLPQQAAHPRTWSCSSKSIPGSHPAANSQPLSLQFFPALDCP